MRVFKGIIYTKIYIIWTTSCFRLTDKQLPFYFINYSYFTSSSFWFFIQRNYWKICAFNRSSGNFYTGICFGVIFCRPKSFPRPLIEGNDLERCFLYWYGTIDSSCPWHISIGYYYDRCVAAWVWQKISGKVFFSYVYTSNFRK